MDEEFSSRWIFFSPWSFLFLFFLIIIGNLFIIDIALFWNTSKPGEKPLATKAVPVIVAANSNTVDSSCPVSCQQEIAKAVANTPLATNQTNVVQNSAVKEFFVPLGGGSSTASDWEDIPSAQAYIDSTSYGKIKTVTFEASLYTPTGNQTAYARLFNVTDKHPVWSSDVSIEGGTPQLRLSQNITLDQGSKLYQVQMKTQLQARTNLESARIHILTF